jgi:hypothetical protein
MALLQKLGLLGQDRLGSSGGSYVEIFRGGRLGFFYRRIVLGRRCFRIRHAFWLVNGILRARPNPLYFCGALDDVTCQLAARHF